MASIQMNAEQLTRDVERRDGRTVVVLRQGDDELVIVPCAGREWVSIWGIGLAFDRMSEQVRVADVNDDHGHLAPAAVIQDPFGGPSSGAG